MVVLLHGSSAAGELGFALRLIDADCFKSEMIRLHSKSMVVRLSPHQLQVGRGVLRALAMELKESLRLAIWR